MKPDDLTAYIAERRADPDWRGCNVTMPHKAAVMDLVDDPGDIRGTIGAMNTVVRQKDGSLIGTNTDAAGFYAPLAELDLEGAPVAVVGAGGAARAVLFALARANVGPGDDPQPQPAEGDGPARDFRPRRAMSPSSTRSSRPRRCSSIRAASA